MAFPASLWRYNKGMKHHDLTIWRIKAPGGASIDIHLSLVDYRGPDDIAILLIHEKLTVSKSLARGALCGIHTPLPSDYSPSTLLFRVDIIIEG